MAMKLVGGMELVTRRVRVPRVLAGRALLSVAAVCVCANAQSLDTAPGTDSTLKTRSVANDGSTRAADGPAAATSPVEELPRLHPPSSTALSSLNVCLSMPAGAARDSCLIQAGAILEQGLLWQACWWGVAVSTPAASGQVHPKLAAVECGQQARTETAVAAAAYAKDRTALLNDGLKLARRLGHEPVEPLVAELVNLRARAGLLAEAGRGGISLISQGGVSLGSWQGGYTYLLTEVLKERRNALVAAKRLPAEAPAVVTSTGASAGAINALISGFEGCSQRAVKTPENSFYYDVWVDKLGFYRKDGRPGLLGDDAARLALFSATPVNDAVNEAKRYASNLEHVNAGCSFSLGVVVTHLKSIRTPVHVDATGKPLMTVPRLTERFALQVSPKQRAEPRIDNLAPPAPPPLSTNARTPDNAFYAKLGAADRVQLPLLLDAVRASGAYPVAFEPVKLTYQSWEPRKGARGGYEVHKDVVFVDGGTLDNAPIRLASTINQWKQAGSPNPWLADPFADPMTYIFVNPGVTSWDTHPEPERDEGSGEPTIWETYSKFATDLFNTGLEAELSGTAEQLEFIREQRDSVPRLSVPRRNMPITGERLLHFMAFLNHDFRDFDFHVGMADAAEQLRGLSDMTGHEGVVEARQQSPKFSCLRAYYAKALPFENNAFAHRVLKPEQLNADGFASTCGAPGVSTRFRQLLSAMHNFKYWSSTEQYRSRQEIEKFFELLDEVNFEFVDGDPQTDELLNERRDIAFRRLLQQLIDRLAAKHDGVVGTAINVGGRAAADALVYREFPDWTLQLGLALNGLEAGIGHSILGSDRLGWRADLRIRSYKWGGTTIRNHVEAGRRVRERRFAGHNSASFDSSVVWGLPWFPFIGKTAPGLFDLELGLGLTYDHSVAPLANDEALMRHSIGATALAKLLFLQRVYFGIDYTHYDWALGTSRLAAGYGEDPPATQWDEDNLQLTGGLRFFPWQ